MPTCSGSTSPKQAQLKALNDEIDTLTKQLQAQGDKLSDAERAARAKTIDDKKKQLDRSAEDAQNDMQNEMQELYGALASKVYDVLNDYVKKNGYTLVLDFSQQQNPVLYAADSTNITKAIIDAYNVKSGVPAPTSPAAGASNSHRPRQPPGQQLRGPRLPSSCESGQSASECRSINRKAPDPGAFLHAFRSEFKRIARPPVRAEKVLRRLWKKLWISSRLIHRKIRIFPLANLLYALINLGSPLFI